MAPLFAPDGSISTDVGGIRRLNAYYQLVVTRNAAFSFENLNHMDANLAAVLLPIMEEGQAANGERPYVNLSSLSNRFEVFRRNGFSNLVAPHKPINNTDDRESTVAIQQFLSTEGDAFCTYQEEQLWRHRAIHRLQVSEDLQDRLNTHFNELFANVGDHAQTPHKLTVCGQYFPSSRHLNFTITDRGVGFLPPINALDASVETGEAAIQWALRGNTTKKTTLGGTALRGIADSCRNTPHILGIYSSGAYVEVRGNRTSSWNIPAPYMPGTIVNLTLTLP